jgi:ABC-type glycerol-3-phosphate transport system substrate-binding protein
LSVETIQKQEDLEMRGFRTIIFVTLLAVMLTACCPPPTSEVVIQTQVVEKEKEVEVIQTQVVEKEVVTEVTAVPGAPTRSDGLPVYTGGPAELRMGWWGNDDRAARTLQVIALFEAAYPEIKVLGEPNGGAGDHFQILDTQLAASNPPDLIQFGGNWPDYVQYLELDFIHLLDRNEKAG